MKYYLAGKMSGLPDFGYDRFASAAATLRSAGFSVFSPHEIDFDEEEPGELPYGDYIRAGLKLLLDCDAIVLLPGWSDSRGACLERRVALTIRIPVYYYSSNPPYVVSLTDNLRGGKQ